MLALGEHHAIVRAFSGEVAEWSKAHAWKVCRRETVSRVRIPVSPPVIPGSTGVTDPTRFSVDGVVRKAGVSHQVAVIGCPT